MKAPLALSRVSSYREAAKAIGAANQANNQEMDYSIAKLEENFRHLAEQLQKKKQEVERRKAANHTRFKEMRGATKDELAGSGNDSDVVAREPLSYRLILGQVRS